MKSSSLLIFVLLVSLISPIFAANWNDPQGNLVTLPSEVTVSETARPRDSLEERTMLIVEQARIAMRRASQARQLQTEAEQHRRVVETAAMERAEAAQEMSSRLARQQQQDQQIKNMAEQEAYEAQFTGLSPEDRKIYELALLERREAEQAEQDRRVYEQALQERRDNEIRALALKEQQEEQDRKIRELALQERGEVEQSEQDRRVYAQALQERRDHEIRVLALKEQREEQDRKVRERAQHEQQEEQDRKIRELALQEQMEQREQSIRDLAAKLSVPQENPSIATVAEPVPENLSAEPVSPTASRDVAAAMAVFTDASAGVAAPRPVLDSPVQSAEVAGQTASAGTTDDDHYLVGAGDVLYVSIWKDDVLTRNVTVSPDGTFTFPLIGSIQAAGRSLSELRHELEQKLAPFVPDPVLDLELKQVNSMFIFVLGRVNNPGRFALNAPVNVLQALAIAGGLTPYANRKEIQVIREEESGTRAYAFNYKDVTRGRSLEENIRLQRGDIILVP